MSLSFKISLGGTTIVTRVFCSRFKYTLVSDLFKEREAFMISKCCDFPNPNKYPVQKNKKKVRLNDKLTVPGFQILVVCAWKRQ